MTSKNTTSNSEEIQVSTEVENRKLPSKALLKKGGLALALLGVIGAGIYQLQINKYLQESVARQEKLLEQINVEVKDDAQQVKTVLSVRLDEIDRKMQPLTGLYQKLQNNELAHLVSETEQTLILASEALYLTNDINVALKLLRYVDNKVTSARFPELVKLHGALQRDISTLSLLPQTDTVKEVARLEALIENIDKLPLHIDIQRTISAKVPPLTHETKESRWKKIFQDVGHELKSLVHIRRIDKPEAALLSVDQVTLLRENMRLRLMSAKIALLTQNASSYKADLQAVQKYLSIFFDQQQTSTQKAQAVVRQLLRAPLGRDKPTLTSLEVVRVLPNEVVLGNRGGKE